MALAKPETLGYRKSNAEEPETIESFIKMINSDNKTVQLEGALGIRKLLSIESKNKNYIKEVIDSGIIKRVIEFMTWSDESIFQIESTWILTNICAGTSEDVEYVINLGVFDMIFDLLSSDLSNVVEQATWAIGNISGDNEEFKQLCFDKEVMDKLIDVLEVFPTTEITRNVIWNISNLVQLKPLTGKPWEDIKKGFPLLKKIFSDGQTNETLVHAIKAVSYLVESYVQEVIDLECVPILVQQLKANDNQANVINSMRTLRHIIEGTDEQMKLVLSFPDFLPQALDLVLHGNGAVRKDVYLAVYNIVTRSEENVFFVIENDKFMKTLKKAMTSEEEIVRGKVCEMIDIFTAKGNPEQILKMVTEHNFLGCLITMIEHENILIQKLGLDACLKVLNSGNIISDYNPYLLYFEEAEMFDKIMLLMSYPDLTDTAALILTFLEGDNMGY